MRIDQLRKRISLISFIVLILSCLHSADAQQLYWVGNGGNWNDAANWSLTSGGPGGAGIPDATTNVFIDTNSGNCTIVSEASANFIELSTSSTLNISAGLSVVSTLDFLQGNITNEGSITAGEIRSTGILNRSFDGNNGTVRLSTSSPNIATLSLNSENLDFGGIDSLIFSESELGVLNTTGNLSNIGFLLFEKNGEVYGDHVIEEWFFSNSYTVFLQNSSTQKVTVDMNTLNGPCDGLATLSSFLDNPDRALLQFETLTQLKPRNFYVRRLRSQDITPQFTFPITFDFSINGGDNGTSQDNDKVDFSNSLSARTLFWVGNTGEWYDANNWSLLSGGPSGECPPTAIDDVFFDENSFDSNANVVLAESAGYCNNFNYIASESGTIIDLPEVYINNDLIILQSFNWDIGFVILSGNREGGASRMQLVRTSGTLLENLQVFSERNIELQDDLNVEFDITISGFDRSVRFITNGHDITTGRIFAINNDMGLDLSNSYITVTGTTIDTEQPLTIRNSEISSVNNTRWEFTNEQTGFETNESEIGSVWFNNPGGSAQAFSSTELVSPYIRFEGFGTLFGNDFILDSLILTPGNEYLINHTNSLTVNSYLESLGDICQPIFFASSVGNIQETLFMPSSATIDMSYTEIQDIMATGGNTFDAGVGSVDLGNNNGWSFRDPNAQEVNRFLGDDIFQCNSEDNVRITLNFSIDEVDSIKWNNGNAQSVTTPFIVNTRDAPAGESEIFAEVFFSNGCSQRDTVMVTVNEQFTFDLGNDTTLCNGAALQLNIPIDNAQYNWSNEEVDQSIFVFESGDYAVTVDSGACSFSDEISILAVDLSQLSLGNDTTLCDEGSLILSVSSEFDGSILWSDNSSSGPTLEVNDSGLYWAEFSEDICVRRDSINITFENAFSVDLGSDTTICNGAEITLSTGRDVGIFNWSTGDTKPLITISDGGTYSVEVQVGTCIASDTVQIERVDIKDFSLGEDQILCLGESIELSIPEGFSGTFDWSTGALTPTIEVTSTDIYRLTISEDICSQSDSVEIVFDNPQLFDLGSDTTLCSGQSLELSLDDLPMDVAIGIEWTTGVSAQPNITVNEEGLYGVAVTIGACTTRDTINVDVAEITPFSLGMDTVICSDQQFMLLAPAESTQLLWSDLSTDESLAITQSGTYWLDVGDGTCSLRDSIMIIVDQEFAIDLGSDTTLCSGETIMLNVGINGGTNLWSTGESSTIITVDEPGTYFVESTQGACAAMDEIDVSFIDVDNFTIGNDTTLCIDERIVLSADLSDQATYIWQDGSNDPTFDVTMGGLYTVTASIERCDATASINVDFQEKPFIELGEDLTLCDPDFITLDAGISDANYLWQDGSTERTIQTLVSDVYVVMVDDGICLTGDTISVSIQDRPMLTIAADGEGSICRGDSVILTASTDGISYQWQDNSTDDQFVATETGLYFAEMSFGVCVVLDSFDLVVNDNPTIVLPPDTTICDNTVITIELPASGLSYDWTGIQSTNNIVTIDESGTYSVIATDDNGCEDEDQFTLSLKETPNFDLGIDETICEGETLELLVTPSFPEIIWNVPNTGSGLSVSSSGVFWAEATLDGCSFRDSITVDVQAFPDVNLGNDTILCQGSMLTLDVTNTDATYNWSTGETTPNITFTGSGSTMISVSVDIQGCTSSDQINVNIKETPEFTLAEDDTICEDEDITISVDNPGDRWSIAWSNGASTNDITVSEPGSYTAVATLDGCSSEDEFALSVQPLPEFDLGEDFSKCEDLTTTLSIDRNDVNVLWQDGTTGNQFVITDPGLYTAIATTDLGCSFTDDIEVMNRECVAFTIYIPNAFSPNQDGRNDRFLASIPDGVFVLEYEMHIYDRWGNQVFEAFDINVGWDGGGLGFQSMQPGVYVYNMRVRYSDDYQSEIQETFTGNITLVE